MNLPKEVLYKLFLFLTPNELSYLVRTLNRRYY